MISTRWLTLALLALTLAACGSNDTSDDSSGGSTSGATGGSPAAVGESADHADRSRDTLSEADLVAEADRNCEAAANEIRALPKAKSLADAQKVGDQSAKITDRFTARLKALSPPASIKSDYEAYLAIVDRVNALAKKVRKAGAEDPASVQGSITDLVKEGAETRRLARKIGFKRCGVSAVTETSPGVGAPPEAP